MHQLTIYGACNMQIDHALVNIERHKERGKRFCYSLVCFQAVRGLLVVARFDFKEGQRRHLCLFRITFRIQFILVL
jgi:hypothetical protein